MTEYSARYNGNLPLTDLSFKLTVDHVGEEPLVIVQTVDGVLEPNMEFDVEFESPELDAYDTDSEDVQFVYDNARAL